MEPDNALHSGYPFPTEGTVETAAKNQMVQEVESANPLRSEGVVVAREIKPDDPLLSEYSDPPKGTVTTIVDEYGRVIDFVDIDDGPYRQLLCRKDSEIQDDGRESDFVDFYDEPDLGPRGWEIQDEYGEVIEFVDYYDQPAFYDPRRKDREIQQVMRPSKFWGLTPMERPTKKQIEESLDFPKDDPACEDELPRWTLPSGAVLYSPIYFDIEEESKWEPPSP